MRYILLTISLIIIGGSSYMRSVTTRIPTPGWQEKERSTSCAESERVREEPPKDPDADRFGFGPWFVNADRTIWAGNLGAGAWVSGRRGNKVIWIRPQGTKLRIAGHRLDGDAPPLKAYIPCCYPSGFQATGIVFPEPGCWEVKAKAGSSSLTFTVLIK